jgi:hypothetical protein
VTAFASGGQVCGWTSSNTVYTECAVGNCNVPSGASTGTCPTVAQDGQSCSSTADCTFPAYCTTDGTCVFSQAASCL